MIGWHTDTAAANDILCTKQVEWNHTKSTTGKTQLEVHLSTSNQLISGVWGKFPGQYIAEVVLLCAQFVKWWKLMSVPVSHPKKENRLKANLWLLQWFQLKFVAPQLQLVMQHHLTFQLGLQQIGILKCYILTAIKKLKNWNIPSSIVCHIP